MSRRLSKASLLLAISPGDTDYFRTKYGNALFVGPFHPDKGAVHPTGKEITCFFTVIFRLLRTMLQPVSLLE